MARALRDFGLAQGAWFAAVLGAAAGQPLWSVLAAARVLLVQVCWPAAGAARGAGLIRVLAIAAAGTAVDGVWAACGWLGLRDPALPAWQLWAWLFGLWLSFATTLGSALACLAPRPLLAVLVGGVCGPLAWLGGERLGAVRLTTPPTVSLVAQGLAWGLGLPLMLAVVVPRRVPEAAA